MKKAERRFRGSHARCWYPLSKKREKGERGAFNEVRPNLPRSHKERRKLGLFGFWLLVAS